VLLLVICSKFFWPPVAQLFTRFYWRAFFQHVGLRFFCSWRRYYFNSSAGFSTSLPDPPPPATSSRLPPE
jgi:hypothetical protein